MLLLKSFSGIIFWLILFYIIKKRIHSPLFINENYFNISLVPISFFLTFSLYYVFIHVFYIPQAISGYAVFLSPRFYGSMNDLPSGIFRQWYELFFILPLLILILFFAAYLGLKKYIRFKLFLILLYILSLIISFLFILLTENGVKHIVLQSKSINNGIWISFNVLSKTPDFMNTDLPGKIQYIYKVFCSNTSGYTIPGTNHPSGLFVISFIVLRIAKFFTVDLFGGGHRSLAIAWGIIITLINAMIIPLVMIIAKKAFNDKIARYTGIFILFLPSACVHICAIIDGIGSVFIAAGLLFMIKTLIYTSEDEKSHKGFFLSGLGAGTFFTLAAQITFGHAIPIIGLILAYIMLRYNKKFFNNNLIFFIGLAIAAILYFVLEYYISDGQSSWIIRAFKAYGIVAGQLIEARPYPEAYIANFIIMSVMGGFLFLPVLIYIIIKFFRIKQFIKTGISGNYQVLVKQYLIISSLIMLVMLLFQTSVRLEVERIWHWLFIPVWSLSGIFIISILDCFAVDESDIGRNIKINPVIVLSLLQLFTTVILAMCIQDYY